MSPLLRRLKALEYLPSQLLVYRKSLCSWSDYGHQIAAKILNCPLDGVLPTTNHLESFNGVLKRKHLHRWQRRGRRLRVDVLLRLLATKILPTIFEQRAAERNDTRIWEAQMRTIPGRCIPAKGYARIWFSSCCSNNRIFGARRKP